MHQQKQQHAQHYHDSLHVAISLDAIACLRAFLMLSMRYFRVFAAIDAAAIDSQAIHYLFSTLRHYCHAHARHYAMSLMLIAADIADTILRR